MPSTAVTCCGWYALPDVDLSFASLLLLTFAGAVVWPLNPEAAVVLHVSAGDLHPLPVALVAAVGQLGAHALLWSGGAWLRRNWRWFDRQCTRTQARFGPRLGRGSVPVVMSAGVLGFPPAWAAATLGPGLGLSPRLVLPLLFLGRIVRFGALALMASGLLGGRIPEIVSVLLQSSGANMSALTGHAPTGCTGVARWRGGHDRRGRHAPAPDLRGRSGDARACPAVVAGRADGRPGGSAVPLVRRRHRAGGGGRVLGGARDRAGACSTPPRCRPTTSRGRGCAGWRRGWPRRTCGWAGRTRIAPSTGCVTTNQRPRPPGAPAGC